VHQQVSFTAEWTEEGELFTFGHGGLGQLGHGGTQTEPVPRLVEALAGKKVSGAAIGEYHTAVWTDVGELFTFGFVMIGFGSDGQLGHGGTQTELLVPRLVEALAGKKVIGAAVGELQTAVWTEVFTFGFGNSGSLGHGGEQDELERRVDALAAV
jgi:alpha-tubulin suppressor-like RCC1 family protein